MFNLREPANVLLSAHLPSLPALLCERAIDCSRNEKEEILSSDRPSGTFAFLRKIGEGDTRFVETISTGLKIPWMKVLWSDKP